MRNDCQKLYFICFNGVYQQVKLMGRQSTDALPGRMISAQILRTLLMIHTLAAIGQSDSNGTAFPPGGLRIYGCVATGFQKPQIGEDSTHFVFLGIGSGTGLTGAAIDHIYLGNGSAHGAGDLLLTTAEKEKKRRKSKRPYPPFDHCKQLLSQ